MSAARSNVPATAFVCPWQSLISQTTTALDQLFNLYLEALAGNKNYPVIFIADKEEYKIPKGQTFDVLLQQVKLQKFVLLDIIKKQLLTPAVSFDSVEALDHYYEQQIAQVIQFVKQDCAINMRLFCEKYGLSLSVLLDQLIRPETYQQIMRIHHLFTRQLFMLSWFKSGSATETGDDAGTFRKIINALTPICESRLADIALMNNLDRIVARTQQLEVFKLALSRIFNDSFHKPDVSERLTQTSAPLPEDFAEIIAEFPVSNALDDLLKAAEMAAEKADENLLEQLKSQARKKLSKIHEAEIKLSLYLEMRTKELTEEKKEEKENYRAITDAIAIFDQAVQDNQRLYAICQHIQKMQSLYLERNDLVQSSFDELTREAEYLSKLFSAQVNGSIAWRDAGARIAGVFSGVIESYKSFTATYAEPFSQLEKLDKGIENLHQLQGEIGSSKTYLQLARQGVAGARQSLSDRIKNVSDRVDHIKKIEIKKNEQSWFKKHWWKVAIGVVVGCAIGVACAFTFGIALGMVIGIGAVGGVGGGAAALGISVGVEHCCSSEATPPVGANTDSNKSDAVTTIVHEEDEYLNLSTSSSADAKKSNPTPFSRQPALLFSPNNPACEDPSAPLLQSTTTYGPTYGK